MLNVLDQIKKSKLLSFSIIRFYRENNQILIIMKEKYTMQTEYNKKHFDQFIDMVAELVLTYHTQQNQLVEKDIPNKSKD